MRKEGRCLLYEKGTVVRGGERETKRGEGEEGKGREGKGGGGRGKDRDCA